MEITVGMKGETGTTVEREDTALEVGSGSLLVYATPLHGGPDGRRCL